MEREKYSPEFKLAAVNELSAGKPATQIAREKNIHRSLVFRWRRELRTRAFPGNGNTAALEARLAEKDRLIGKLYAENELLKKSIASLRQRAGELR